MRLPAPVARRARVPRPAPPWWLAMVERGRGRPRCRSRRPLVASPACPGPRQADRDRHQEPAGTPRHVVTRSTATEPVSARRLRPVTGRSAAHQRPSAPPESGASSARPACWPARIGLQPALGHGRTSTPLSRLSTPIGAPIRARAARPARADPSGTPGTPPPGSSRTPVARESVTPRAYACEDFQNFRIWNFLIENGCTFLDCKVTLHQC